ncbi:[protein-PII] uridylyltransferase [Thalassotalea mangrovi]|uniref:Bifunctional uridylyltransferase/uridylyl-removing enzyme n=2 Tax=Thalassotalea mangrovi TaxID=2572245 RepID=A0A4U1B4B0_9GAMM|nr:[protein-PII] uridylyltransferase [Thalassotalea mangrovi]
MSLSDFQQQSEAFYQWLQQSFAAHEVTELVHTRAEYVDLVLKKIWCQQHLDEHQIALMAVGGYGRGELHPYSDIDILILTQKNLSQELQDYIGAFITQLWDIRLDIGHSVRSVKECIKLASKDITIATNLLESRLICGNQALADELWPQLWVKNFWPSEKFFIAKRNEQFKRHQQYKGAAYTLEPNLKANPGALRDIQNISWVAMRHFHADSLYELVQHDYLTLNEFYELMECQDYLWRMRFALHLIAGRSENRLLFDYQGDVARLMGFGEDGKKAIERMMKRFFRVINYVSELNEMLLQHFQQAILNHDVKQPDVDIDKDFMMVGNLIQAKNYRAFVRPEMMLKIFLVIADNPQIKGIHSDTIRLLRNSRRRLISELIDYAECRRLFMALMRHPRGLGRAFNLMYRHEMLGHYLPEWQNIVGQMQFDLFHAYSVDEHSYRLIKNLYRFSLPEHNHEFPLCSKIVQRIRKPELLYIAGIFHDIAKGRGGSHSELGAVDAINFGEMHGLTKHDTKMISWLVKYHLLMSVTAQRRDISDPNVIREFGKIVRDEAHLDYLYCLTVADMRATNESLWNSWKGNLLEELYYATKSALRRGLEKPVEYRAQIKENQQQALMLLNQDEISKDLIKPVWKQFKPDYFLRYSPQQIRWHSKAIFTHDRSSPLVLVSPKPYRGGTEVFIYTKDKENIFATIVAVLGGKKLSIHDAKILTSKDGYTLNTFVVLDSKGHALKDDYHMQDIKDSLTHYLQSKEPVLIVPQPIPLKFRQFNIPTQVSFMPYNNAKMTSMELVALDRPGLLAEIGKVFQEQGLSIHSAKITTFGERAEDMFLISTKDNHALSEQQQMELEQKLCLINKPLAKIKTAAY